jgi:general secretion pathway protein D
MMSPMRLSLVVALLSITAAAYPQASSSPSPAESASVGRVENGVPIAKLIATVAKKTGKKFVVDPRVHAEVALVGQDPASVSYSDLLTILHIYGYVAAEYGGYVNVVPDANARQQPSPLLTGKESRPDSEIVTAVITVKNVSAAQLVPILRPLIPQYCHLATLICTNKLILVDTFGNVKRLEAVIESMDVGEPYKPEKCEPPRPAP